MGGDFAPREVVRGAIDYASERSDHVILVGAGEQIEMGEHPAAALRSKKRASVVVATELVRDDGADAVVSAGSTGATLAAAICRLGRIDGIDRPALGAHLVTPEGPIMLLDFGAIVDCDADNLVQFGVMGSIYAEHVLRVARPRVGLLNIGEEVDKGDRLAQEANHRLRHSGLNF